MDSARRITVLRDKKGIALVYIALMMVALCAFFGLAVDIGYMYVAKGQLQNASDAAALAGVVKLKSIGAGVADPNDLVQKDARDAAVLFANSNKVAGVTVEIVNDNSNTLSSTNDITVGRWSDGVYTPGVIPVNAIQARARRTADSPGNEVNLFLSGVIGWNSMGTSADAVAGLTTRASNYISICYQGCPESGTKTFDPPLVLDASNDGTNTQDFTKKFAWTTLSDSSTSNSDLVDMICNEPASVQVCGTGSIYTTMGTDQASLKAMEWAFYNPGFDGDNKLYVDETKAEVKSWMVQVPVTETCPPGAQGKWDPHKIVKYATIEIIAVCASGTGVPCKKELSSGVEYVNYHAPPQDCKDYPNNTIIIKSVSCSACGEDAAGLKPSLLR